MANLRAKQSVTDLLALWQRNLQPISRMILAPHVARIKAAYARYRETGNIDCVSEFAYDSAIEEQEMWMRARSIRNRERKERILKRSVGFRHAEERARWGTSRQPTFQLSYIRHNNTRIEQIKGDKRLSLRLNDLLENCHVSNLNIKLLSEVKSALERGCQCPYGV